MSIPKPYGFAVFIARKSGSRTPAAPSMSGDWKKRFMQEVVQLTETTTVNGNADLEAAQQALRRCFYLSKEMFSIADMAPESAAMTGRSIVENALLGSYLALYEAGGERVAGFLKKQRGHAQKLREYFFEDDMLGALGLIPEISFIARPLDSSLDAITGAPDLRTLCARLDEKEPFSRGGLATLIYNETYAALSNIIVHANPQTLNRHDSTRIAHSRKKLNISRPEGVFVAKSLQFSILPAMGGLCGSLARALNMPSDLYDRWLNEVNTVDGYEWSGSLVRTAAVSGLAELANLPDVYALNAAGYATRVLATHDAMLNASNANQLIAACEIIDRARQLRRRPKVFAFRMLAYSSLILQPCRTAASDRTPKLVEGNGATDPQVLLAALALVYAGIWPDDTRLVNDRLEAFDSSAPHHPHALEKMAINARTNFKDLPKRWRNQVDRMQ